MFTRILSLLTTTAVVLHALLGCCAHHAHAEHDSHATQGGSCATQAAPAGRHCSCHHKDAESPATDDEPGHRDHGQDEPCNEPDCQFVGNQRVEDVRLALSLPVWQPPIATIDVAANLSAPCTFGGPPGESGHLLAAESLRALTQVWLL